MKLYHACLLLCVFCLGATNDCAAQSTMMPWLTRSADNSRSGWNSHETQLTQASVAAKGILRATIIPVNGDARGMEAQPLILPGVKLADGSTHDVMVLPSMADRVRGVDATTGADLWDVTLGTPINGNFPTGPAKPKPDGCVGQFPTIDCHAINDKWGVLSTGVIDPDTKREYLVAWISQDHSGSPLTARYFMFVLNVADGTQAVAPVLIQEPNGSRAFNSQMRKQRSSLVETDVNGVKTVFGCSGTINETGTGASGFCFAFDVASNTVTAMLALTTGEGAGVWMGGQGAAADAQGNLYVLTGNGDFDGVKLWGESFLKLAYTPPSNGAAASLKVIDHWTPWTDLARTGQTAAQTARLAGMSASTAAFKPVGSGMNMPLKNATLVAKINDQGTPTVLVIPRMASGAWSDEDWGSAGPACIFTIGVCVATGKDGIAYPIKTVKLGGTTPLDLKDPKANCLRLAAAPVWLTMSPGPVDPCPANPRTLNFFPWGDTAHLHMTPVQFFDPLLHSWTIFAWGENSQLHKWKVSSTGVLTYVAQSHEFASANVRENPPGGMPGGFCAGSSNGADPDSAILACTIPYGNANANLVNGRLLVYDAVHLAADGSLKVLWDSQVFNVQFLFNKFDPPVIDGGQIYVPNYSGGVDLYRLVE
jgi:hypothetical protein